MSGNNVYNYLNQDLDNPKYFFHGSPKLLDKINMHKSHDSKSNKVNIDNAVFVTPSFLMATSYAFKDTIKKESIKLGLDCSFDISFSPVFPFMSMENVVVDDEIFGYVYVFKNDGTFKNEPKGSLQYKSYKNLEPINVIKIYYKDYKDNYEIKNRVNISKIK